MTKEEFKELQLQQQQSGKPLKSRAAHIHSLMKLLHAEDGGMVMYENAWKPVVSSSRSMMSSQRPIQWNGVTLW